MSRIKIMRGRAMSDINYHFLNQMYGWFASEEPMNYDNYIKEWQDVSHDFVCIPVLMTDNKFHALVAYATVDEELETIDISFSVMYMWKNVERAEVYMSQDAQWSVCIGMVKGEWTQKTLYDYVQNSGYDKLIEGLVIRR